MRLSTDEADWSWSDPADQQLVVEDGRSALLVWIYLHVLLSKTFATVVGTMT